MKSIYKLSVFQIFKWLGCLTLAFTIAFSHAEPNAMSVLKKKPLFNLNLEASNARYFIFVNGVLVFKEYFSQGQISTTLPVNHWMHPSDNSIAILVMPEHDRSVRKGAKVKIELQVGSDGVDGPSQTIATLDFKEKYTEEGSPTKDSSPEGRFDSLNGFESADAGDVWVSEVSAQEDFEYQGAVTYQRELTIPSSLPLWAFFNSDDLPDYDAMSDDDYYAARDDLYKEYKAIENAMKEGDIESILPLFTERSRELDAAYYFEPGTTQNNLRRSMEGAARSDSHMLAELTPDIVGITPEENSKLVSLTREEETAAIGYDLKEGGSQSYHIVFRKQDGKWIITR